MFCYATRALVLLMWTMLWLSTGCAASATASVLPQARTAAQLPLRVFDKTPSGMSIASLPRATPNVVRLALYIDAGSRDAAVPETATLSAWLAAQSVSPALEATVYPDASELTLTCETKALPACVEQLARALAFRNPQPDALSDARTRLRDGQRRALASDPLAQLDQLALRSLLGDTAPHFFPRGVVDSDLVAAGEAVPRFLSDHYGPRRALLVAAGDLEPRQLRDLAEAHFASAPDAVVSRGTRSLVPLETPKLGVSFQERGALAFALSGPDLAAVNDVVQQLQIRVRGLEPTVSLSAYVFPARSGALGLLHLQAADPELAMDRVVQELSRLAVEEHPQHTTLMPRDDLTSSARELGFDFASGGAPAPQQVRFGAAIALAAGPDPGPAGQAQRVDQENKRSEHAQSTFQRALAQLSPKLRGDSDEYAAAVTLDNGAHLDVQFSQGNAVALSIRVGIGAEQDPALTHGQAALLATLTSTACAGMGPELLQSRFAQLGATLGDGAVEMLDHAVGHVERLVLGPAIRLFRDPDILFAERLAVRLLAASLGAAVADHRMDDDEGRLVGGRLERLDRAAQRGSVVRIVDVDDVPAIGVEAQADILVECKIRRALDRDVVAVVDPAEVRKL